ncbi:GntR family transcriptional regulator [uncultured Clostridium sp.]|uniref:GntR family transcriptional regulator n=1 Tax=uncultured Clostridium sp. TaxID=59620 RepID=UPI002604B57C|nr:GntR family transcriptional regulator [uncultured Clostridium sp.]
MNIIVSNSSSIPLYLQIKAQIESEIFKGNLNPTDPLPSIRVLAKELRVSIITTKKAYEELEKDGFIQTVAGKGSFISSKNNERLKEITMSKIEDSLSEIIKTAKSIDLAEDNLIEVIKILYQEV